MGNNSDYLLADNSNGGADAGNVENINTIPVGGLYKPNPVTGAVTPISLLEQLGTTAINDYRLYPQYSEINIPRHALAANYNGLQADWEKRQGHLVYGVNYTWSKSLGYKGGYYNGNATDPTNFRNNYGVLSYDRTNVFNSSYSYDFGNPIHRRFLSAVGNGWQLSGITTVQSGQDLQSIYQPGFNTAVHLSNTVNGTTTTSSETNITRLGTPDVVLVPNITCNPGARTGVAHQYINPNCFQLPQLGVNGPTEYPYIHGPAYLDSDLTAVKSFKIRERQTLKFRFEAFNFINHPLDTFTPSATAANLTFVTNNTINPNLVSSQATVSPGFGTVSAKTNRRIVEMALKFYY